MDSQLYLGQWEARGGFLSRARIRLRFVLGKISLRFGGWMETEKTGGSCRALWLVEKIDGINIYKGCFF